MKRIMAMLAVMLAAGCAQAQIIGGRVDWGSFTTLQTNVFEATNRLRAIELQEPSWWVAYTNAIDATNRIKIVEARTQTWNQAATTTTNLTNTITVSEGKVGIGTNTPASKLDVNGALTVRGVQTNKTDSTTALIIQNAAGNTNTLTVDTVNARVGIGTNPSYKLDISENRNDLAMSLLNSHTNGYGARIRSVSASSLIYVLALQGNNGATPILYGMADGKVGIGTNAPGALLHVDGGDVYIGGSGDAQRDLRWLRSGTVRGGISTANNQLTFYGGASSLAHMSLDSSGKVGIGTNLPASALDVNGNLTVRGAQTNLDDIVVQRSAASAQIIVDGKSTSDSVLHIRDGGSSCWTIGRDGSDSDKLKILYGSESLALQTGIIIDGNGQVGILTNTPASALDVNGSIICRSTNYLFWTSSTNYVAMWGDQSNYYLQAVSNGTAGPVKTNTLW